MEELLPEVSVDAVLYYLYRNEGSPDGHTIAGYNAWVKAMVTQPYAELVVAPEIEKTRLMDADEPLTLP